MLARTAARTRDHPRNRISTTPANPQAHTIGGQGTRERGATGKSVSGRGSANPTILTVTAAGAIFSTMAGLGVWLPKLISSAKGIKNFTNATNHSQYRT